ncbi:D123-domain-containing protein [Fragilariopsis cylindrus CCMP1102]|uniref:D123-domain-containing protein n=1 Tax=Fragilariopsis cylindrus CCMP1102 TaxID=635003 RepID=A0A1E7FTM6_9STRA|nr:D123-domain-containing protein [Fragilariopsis cylindrus CCMP1102]|eukprot:OEU21530.1 D123-domain-containing protein [Fragilariopsis cylindrus CCMP1102]
MTMDQQSGGMDATKQDSNNNNTNESRETDADADADADAGSCGPRPTIREVLACQTSSWYSTFSNIVPLLNKNDNNGENDNDNNNNDNQIKLRKNITIKSVIISGQELLTIAPTFEKYLLYDGVKLPHDATKLSSCAGYSSNREVTFDSDDEDAGWGAGESDSEVEGSDSDSLEEKEEINFHFPQLNQKIMDILNKGNHNKGKGKASFGNDGVVPKLNWSAPRDSIWINEGTLKCHTPGDIYLLLKSSDFITYDILYNSLKGCSDYNDNLMTLFPPLELTLKKWCNLNPCQEFRCFIRRDELLCVSQRQHSVHYPYLITQSQTTSQTQTQIENYVMDIYIDKKDRIWILDFNPWSTNTDSLLYDWNELTSMDNDDDHDEDRIRITEAGGSQVKPDPLSSYRAPIDTVNLASMTQNGNDSKQFEEFMKLCQKRPTYWEDNDEDSE